jgi:hypothetical protein
MAFYLKLWIWLVMQMIDKQKLLHVSYYMPLCSIWLVQMLINHSQYVFSISICAIAAYYINQTPFTNIYYHVFRALLRLATDVDLVTRQLFEPLVFQLIHWFTGNTKMESKDTMTLLDAIGIPLPFLPFPFPFLSCMVS